MRLLYSPLSSNARRAVMTAITLGIDVELVPVDLGRAEHRQADFLAKNPNGKVPVLEDDGFVLTESHAIMLYLAEKTPGQTLLPTDLRGRADVNRWLFWCAYHFTPAVAVLNWERMVKSLLGMGPPDPKEVERGERMFGECAQVLDAHLSKHDWLAQDRLTLADIAVATPLMTKEISKLPIDGHRAIQAWFARIKELPAWQATEPKR